MPADTLKYMDDETLKELLETHRVNLRHLELQKAQYGALVPLHIVNQITSTEGEIRLIEAELQRRSGGW
ncbi:MAG: hypothetical protein H8D78_14420 [Chloroflexi bacterium]|nr:hypothetical protein [Chloroflexota bacterium]